MDPCIKLQCLQDENFVVSYFLLGTVIFHQLEMLTSEISISEDGFFSIKSSEQYVPFKHPFCSCLGYSVTQFCFINLDTKLCNRREYWHKAGTAIKLCHFSMEDYFSHSQNGVPWKDFVLKIELNVKSLTTLTCC